LLYKWGNYFIRVPKIEEKKIEEKKNFDSRLRKICDKIPPNRRRILVYYMFTVFAVLAIYMAVTAIIFWNNPRQLPHIDPIKQLDITHSKNDSINPLNFNDYGIDEQ
jgi:hypothetical protein